MSCAPAKRRELSRSGGTPSSWELDVESCSTVARGFDSEDTSDSGAIEELKGTGTVYSSLSLASLGILAGIEKAWHLKATKICPPLSRSSLGDYRFSEGPR